MPSPSPAAPQGLPTFTRLEYWDPATGAWTLGHAGINLLHPDRYVQRLASNGKLGRATAVDTGEVWGPTVTRCAYCATDHPATPQPGMCLLW